MGKAKKIRNLVNSKIRRKVNKSNVCWEHLKLMTLEILPYMEYCENNNNLNEMKKLKRLLETYNRLIYYMESRIKNEIDNLEYLKISNREKQKKLSEKQLRALFEKEAIKGLEKDGVPYTEDNLKIKLDHMIQAYYERQAEKYNENKEVKEILKKRTEDFNPEGLDFDIDKPM